MEIDIVISQTLSLQGSVSCSTVDIYGSVFCGDIYFSNLFGREEWKCASDQDKNAALFEATQSIDRFNYLGQKTTCTQKLQFPRGNDTCVPKDIEYATYEEAYQILTGRSNEDELAAFRMQQQRFGPVHVQYMPGARLPPNVAAGILSSKAWRLIAPYFRRAEEIKLIRV